jgi:signal peptidase I
MPPNPIRLTRRVVGLIAIALLGILVVFSLVTRIAPLTGRELFTIGGGSMEAAIPIGSMVAVTRADPMTIVAGDVVTIRADNGVVITHRVTRVIDRPEGRFFELKGDANASPDPVLAPARAIVGRVGEVVPGVGYLRAFLSTTPGVIAALSLVGALLLLYLLLGMVQPPARPAGQEAFGSRLDSIGP